MKKQNLLLGYLLIGIGAYFLLKQLKLPILTDFYSWPTLLIIIGFAFLIYSINKKEYSQLFTSIILLGLGIHFHGLKYYTFWIDHWAIYLLIVGIAFIVRFIFTKDGILPGLILTGIALIMIFSIQLPEWFQWINDLGQLLEKYWPIALIVVGLFVLFRKK